MLGTPTLVRLVAEREARASRAERASQAEREGIESDADGEGCS